MAVDIDKSQFIGENTNTKGWQNNNLSALKICGAVSKEKGF